MRKVVSVIMLLFAVSVSSGMIYVRNDCAPLIRRIYLTGMDNRLRGDLSDALQRFKLQEITPGLFTDVETAVRKVYRANCLEERLGYVFLRLDGSDLYVQVRQRRMQ